MNQSPRRFMRNMDHESPFFTLASKCMAVGCLLAAVYLGAQQYKGDSLICQLNKGSLFEGSCSISIDPVTNKEIHTYKFGWLVLVVLAITSYLPTWLFSKLKNIRADVNFSLAWICDAVYLANVVGQLMAMKYFLAIKFADLSFGGLVHEAREAFPGVAICTFQRAGHTIKDMCMLRQNYTNQTIFVYLCTFSIYVIVPLFFFMIITRGVLYYMVAGNRRVMKTDEDSDP